MWPVTLGMVLGLRHATDADHVVAIASMLEKRGGLRPALWMAVIWGLGHSASFFCVGLLIVVFRLHLPAAFESVAEAGVALMLILLGGATLLSKSGTDESHRKVSLLRSVWRPLGVGLVHGLAGSAGIGLLAMVSVPTQAGALAYLFCFGFGTVVGMAATTLILSVSLNWSLQRNLRWHGGFLKVAGVASIGMGIALLLSAA